MSEKRVAAFFDFDGTLFSGHFWEGVVKYHFWHKINRIQLVIFLATHMPLYFLGRFHLQDEEAFKTKWGEDLAIVFKRLSREEGRKVFYWIYQNYVKGLLKASIIATLRGHREKGHVTFVLSGTYADFLETMKLEIGVDYAIGTALEVKDGKYTGEITPPLCFGEDKSRLLREFISRNGLDIDLASSFAYADSFSDLSVLEAVGNPTAVSPDKRLLNLAKKRGWKVIDE